MLLIITKAGFRLLVTAVIFCHVGWPKGIFFGCFVESLLFVPMAKDSSKGVLGNKL